MRKKLFLVCLMLVSLAAAAPSVALPTMPEVKEQFDKGNYADVLKTISKLLALKGKAAVGYERYELYCLRGEAMLRTGAFRTAIDAFGDAAKSTDADDKRGRALGIQLLIRQSKPVGYIPKPQVKTVGKPQPIDIVDPAERKKALDALLIDAKAAAEPRLKAIEGAKTLAPLMDAARIIGDLWAIEMAATGSGEGAKAASSTIGKQSHELISAAVKQMNARVTQVYSDASSEIWEVDQWNRRTRLLARRGLDGPGGSALRDVIATCEKVVPAARDFAKVSGNEDLTADAKAAADLYDRATEALHHNFQPQSGSGGPRLGLPVGPARRVGN